jgi:hypothetical protein
MNIKFLEPCCKTESGREATWCSVCSLSILWTPAYRSCLEETSARHRWSFSRMNGPNIRTYGSSDSAQHRVISRLKVMFRTNFLVVIIRPDLQDISLRTDSDGTGRGILRPLKVSLEPHIEAIGLATSAAALLPSTALFTVHWETLGLTVLHQRRLVAYATIVRKSAKHFVARWDIMS